MNAKQILSAIQSHPGHMMKCVLESNVPTLKTIQNINVIKRSELFVTAGTEFQNRKDIREAIEQGKRGEVQPLPWGHWIDYPFIIAHTNKNGDTNEYIRLYPPSQAQLESFNLTPKVQFFANGNPINRDTAIEYCGAKCKVNDNEKHECFAVNANNIIAIG